MTDKPEAESSMPKDETTSSRSHTTTSSSEYDLTQQLLSLTDKIRDRVEETRECLQRVNHEEEEKRVRKSEREEKMKSLLGGMANMQKSKSSSENVTPGPAEGDPNVAIEAVREAHQIRLSMMSTAIQEQRKNNERQHQRLLQNLQQR